MFLVKNFEKIFYKFFNYLLLLFIYFAYTQSFSINENFLAILIFIYLKDICLGNNFTSNFFKNDYKFLKRKVEFFYIIHRSAIILLISFFTIIMLLKIFFHIPFFKNFFLFIIPFVLLNSILLQFLKNKIKINISIVNLILLLSVQFFKNYNFEFLLLLLCFVELILITFFLDVKFFQIKKYNIFNDIRIYYFYKKIFVNLIIADLYKLIFLFILIIYFFIGNLISLNLIFFFIFIIEISDFFNFLINNKYQIILKKNNQIQREDKNSYKKILNMVIYYLITITVLLLLIFFIKEIEFKLIGYFVLFFYFYNFEKLRNLIFFTREHLILYKKHFLFNILTFLIIIITFINNLNLNEEINLESLNYLLIFLFFFELIYFKIVKKYV
jgi:hypothetical protein